jgi:hypothetical protein
VSHCVTAPCNCVVTVTCKSFGQAGSTPAVWTCGCYKPWQRCCCYVRASADSQSTRGSGSHWRRMFIPARSTSSTSSSWLATMGALQQGQARRKHTRNVGIAYKCRPGITPTPPLLCSDHTSAAGAAPEPACLPHRFCWPAQPTPQLSVSHPLTSARSGASQCSCPAHH